MMPAQTFSAQAAEGRQQAAAAQADAAAAAREAASAVREQARAKAQMARDQAQMARDQAQMAREQAQLQRELQQITVPPFPDFAQRGPSPRQEKMLFSGFVIVVLAAVAIFYPMMRAFARRLEGGSRRSDALDAGSAERLQRIEQAVDAMAIEIERISEGQRFTTKLLSARLEEPSLKS